MNLSRARWTILLAVTGTLLATAGFSNDEPEEKIPPVLTRPAIPPLLLIEPRDSTPLDAKIRASQSRLQHTAVAGPELERLGWLLIAKARESSDPGFYTLAGVAADALERDYALKNEAWLLRGHVLQTRHRFAEAEELGRRVVNARGAA